MKEGKKLRFWRVSRMAKIDYQLRHVCLSIRIQNSAHTRRILITFDIRAFSKIWPENTNFLEI
jgi:hypothetical protein